MSERFNASVKRGHQTTLSNVMGRLQSGSIFSLSPQEFIDLSDLAGALNYWAAQVPDVDVQAEVMFGDFSRKLYVPGHKIIAWPFRVPAKGTLYGSAAENPGVGGSPALRVLTIARVAGDVSTDALVWSRGKQATCYLDVGVEAQPGELLYFNSVIDEDVAPETTGSGFSIVWPAP